jgi:pilus assembly protein CpaF
MTVTLCSPGPAREEALHERSFQRLKTQIHQRLIEELDLARLGLVDDADLRRDVRELAEAACRDQATALDASLRERLLEELMDEVFGLGPLEGLLNDPTVSDILVNDPHTVYVERRGCLEMTEVTFADADHLMRIIQRVVGRIGRRIDETSPMVDARLPDGSRVNAIVPPLALDGPSLSIRRFGKRPLAIEDLKALGSLPLEVTQFLAAAVQARVSFLISGGTGAGKTTLLNALSAFIPPEERLVTIEDSAELILQHRHRVRLETRTNNHEAAGEVTQRDLVRNALRMRPDRILVGEVRGAEVWDMLQAMNTGHEGSLTTVHANSTADALRRLELMVALTGLEVPLRVVREHVAAAIPLVVHLARLKGGRRLVTQVTEVAGVSADGQYVLRDIFGFEQVDVEEGMARGEFHATGYLPECLKRIRANGIRLSDDVFSRRRVAV